MATLNKDFKIKHGLIVEGLQGTINGEVILTENASDSYILNLIGGETLVKSVSNEFDVSVAGELSIDRATVDTYYDYNGAAAAAQSAAEGFATAADTALHTTITGEIATAKGQAEATAQGYADDAEAAAIAYADGLTTTDIAEGTSLYFTNQRALDATAAAYDAAGSAAAAQLAAEGYADGKIADLVDGAPALLDTLNELAAAIADNPNYATDVANLVAGKQDTLTAGDNISIVSDVISVTGLDSADISDFNTAALSATAAAYDVAGAASSAQTAAEGYALGLDSATNTRIDNLDTDDVAEGTAQYFTDARAKESAANLLTAAVQTNITITGDHVTGLTITAENGVADSTTSNLAEGSNLYFTDARAVDALEAVVPNFTAVEVNSVAKQVASTLTAATAGIQVGHAWAKADYRSAEFLVKVAYGTHTEISKVLVTLDSSDNIAITEYGVVGTNGSASTISAGISGSDVQLLVTTANNNSTVNVYGTLLA